MDKCEYSGTFKYQSQVYRFENGCIGVDFYERFLGGSNDVFVSVPVPEEIYVLIKDKESNLLEYRSNENVTKFLDWLDSLNFYDLYQDKLNTDKLSEYLEHFAWKFGSIEEIVTFVTSEVIRLNEVHEFKKVI